MGRGPEPKMNERMETEAANYRKILDRVRRENAPVLYVKELRRGVENGTFTQEQADAAIRGET